MRNHLGPPLTAKGCVIRPSHNRHTGAVNQFHLPDVTGLIVADDIVGLFTYRSPWNFKRIADDFFTQHELVFAKIKSSGGNGNVAEKVLFTAPGASRTSPATSGTIANIGKIRDRAIRNDAAPRPSRRAACRTARHLPPDPAGADRGWHARSKPAENCRARPSNTDRSRSAERYWPQEVPSPHEVKIVNNCNFLRPAYPPVVRSILMFDTCDGAF